MSIVGLGAVSMSDQASSLTGANTLGRDDFLNMLITQLQYQDPLNPMDSTEFTAQLAQFSSLEQLSNINENLGYLNLYQASLNNSQAIGFIGKTVKASGNSIGLASGHADDICFELSDDANDVLVRIYDEAGNIIRALDVGSLGAGENSINWDGLDGEGNSLPDGIYTFDIFAVDDSDKQIDTTTFTTGKVDGVTFKDSTPYLLIGGKKIPFGSVIDVTNS